jgi:tRNA dimethylallyltransferase
LRGAASHGGAWRHLALVGCTASGKSALALEVAQRLGDIEIVVADSMQVYKGMDIGTAKPSIADQERVPHHLLDIADPSASWSVSQWLEAARGALCQIEARGHRALMVAGTPLYFQALVDGLEPPGQWPDVRAELERQLDTGALYQRLQVLDPLAASRITPTNRRRIVRALEVTIGGGKPFSSYGEGLMAFPQTQWRLAGIWLPRATIARRISWRLKAMLEAGLVGEVERLRQGGLSMTARQALGYRQILAHLEHGVPLPDAISEAERRTRAFARRQEVWWRRDPRVRWFETDENPLVLLPCLLGEWSIP